MKFNGVLKKVYKKSNLYLKKNSATILTCAGAVGVIATTVTAVKATPKAMHILEKAKEEKGEELTKFEKVNIALPIYIPSIMLGVSTITCIFGANVINKKHQTSLISAYGLLDNSYKEYKNKVTELYGDDSDNKIKQSITKDRYKKYDVPEVSEGNELFYDYFSNQYFESTMDRVLAAEYEVNRILSLNNSVSLIEFYDLLGLENIFVYDHLGWSVGRMEEIYGKKWIEFEHEKVVMDDGLECCIITIPTEPFIEYFD